MASDLVRGRIGEALNASTDEDWTDVLIVGRSRDGRVRLLYQTNDIAVALGLVQAVDIAIRAPILITQSPNTPTSGTTLKGAN